MNKSRSSFKGSILFELFIALIFLSIAITTSLNLFGQSLKAVKRNIASSEIQNLLRDYLFVWMISPGKSNFIENSEITFPLSDHHQEILYLCKVQSKELGSTKEKIGPINNQPIKYYEVDFQVSNESNEKIFDLKTILLKQKTVGDNAS